METLEQIYDYLKEDQIKAFDFALDFIKPDNTDLFRLMTGVAGSGKTTIISLFIKHCLYTRPDMKIACTATTNKAVKVLHDKVGKVEGTLEFTTVHKQLKLKEQITDSGAQLFIASFDKDDVSADLIIVDESSMISNYKHPREPNSKSLWETIVESAQFYGTKFLFVGDFCQIPPVNEKICVLNMPLTQQTYNIKRFDLLQVVRQAQGSPIIQLATYMREHIDYALIKYDYKDVKTDMGSINIWPRLDTAKVLANIKELVTDPEYMRNSDFVRTVSYTNESNRQLNHMVRHMIFGINSERVPLVIGEKLIANKPIYRLAHKLYPGEPDKFEIIFTTSDEFEVISFANGVSTGRNTDGSDTFESLIVNVKDAFGNPETITMIHPNARNRYNAFINSIAERAKATYSKQLWTYYYTIQKRFADVSYAYTLTGHKSQGSTFTHCCVVEKDIYSNRDHIERNKILYVAYTRPTETLNLIR